MSSEDIGKLFRAEDVVVVEWEVANFSTLPDEVDACYDSPNFAFSDTCFYLTIYPNGENEKQSEGYVALYVSLDAKKLHPYSIDATLCLKDVTGKEQYAMNFTHTFENVEGYGFIKFCKRSVVTSRGSELLPADVLTVRCTLKTLYRCPVRISLFERLLKVSRNMKAILKGEKNSDVVLKVKGRNLKAHRAILEAGSQVFAAMFTHDMLENRTGEISIDDVEADVFAEVLSYMYSGRLEDLCADNVFKLYVAADKYDLDELKELCTIFMSENLSVDVFSQIVALADKHNETELMKFAKDFFRNNSIGILESETWKQFGSENKDIAFQLLVSIMKENAIKEKERQ